MVEVLQFIFGGEVLWGIPRYIGCVILLFTITGVLVAAVQSAKK